MATACFCPKDRVNWNKPGGLCFWNIPCGSKDDLPFYNWYLDDTEGIESIIIPDESVLVPIWVVTIPCFWLHLFFLIPLLEANIFKIYEKDGNLKVDYLSKNACFESIKYSRDQIISASLEEEPAVVSAPRKVRISLLCDHGMTPDEGKWLNMNNSEIDESVLQRCIDLISSKIANINGSNVSSSAYIEPSAPVLANVIIMSESIVSSNNSRNDDNIDIPVATPIVVNQTMECRSISDSF